MNLSSEEKLFKIKQICKGYGPVLLKQEPHTKLWKLITPIKLDKLEGKFSPYNLKFDDPDTVINRYWSELTDNIIVLEDGHSTSKYYRWDNIHNTWVETVPF